MGKLFMYAILAIMVGSAVGWLWGLSSSSPGKMKLRAYGPMAFALAGISYTATVLALGTEFTLSGFVHHEGFVAIAMMWLAPVVGILGAGAALAINYLVLRPAKMPH